jgi:hypothetical protein
MASHPHFHHMLSSPHHNQYGFIMLGNEKVHRIGDADEFYKALGYLFAKQNYCISEQTFTYIQRELCG